MALVETECLNLRSYNLSDADKIVVLLTKDHGIVRAVAKGAKRLTSRFGSGLEPFSLVKATYFQKESQELVSLQKVEIIRSGFEAASRPEALAAFSYFSDLMLSMVPPEDPSEKVFRMANACVTAISDEPASIRHITLYLESWLLRLAGFYPDWRQCGTCRRELIMGAMRLDPDFQIICSDCSRSGAGDILTETQFNMAGAIQRLSPSNFYSTTSKEIATVDALSNITRRMLAKAAGGEFVTSKARFGNA